MAASPVFLQTAALETEHPTLTPVDRYLSTVYDPDRDYLDGEIKERNLGETPHGKIQGFFCSYLSSSSDWRVDAIPELRVQISPTRYRVADICVVSWDAPEELVIRTPPVVCVEVLSREDSLTETVDRADDYFQIGVAVVWIVDPWKRRAYSIRKDGDGSLQRELQTLSVPETAIQVPVAEMFRALDRHRPAATE